MTDKAPDIPVDVQDISHSYGDVKALDGLSFRVQSGEIFGFLGPNGGGKTTLFRILSTIFLPSQGTATITGLDLRSQSSKIRANIGVVFQSPSLDKKLTVEENARHQGHLYGLYGKDLEARIEKLLDRVGLLERRKDKVESLSGGLKRRVEIAKGLLHNPKVLLLDEPSTGLDPGARLDLWTYLRTLASDEGITVLITTHLMEEAERCDRLLILDKGRKVALGAPDELRSSIGGEMVSFRTREIEALKTYLEAVEEKPELRVFERVISLESSASYDFAQRVLKEFEGVIDSVTVGRPTLEDVFIKKTGHRFWQDRKEG